MKRRLRIFMAALAILCIAVLGGFAINKWKAKSDMQQGTLALLNKAYVGIVILEDNHKVSVVDLIESREPLRKIGINRSLALLFEQFDIYIAAKAKPLSPLQLLDAYGNALVCLPHQEAIKRGLPERLVGQKRSVIVYSVGANGKDEQGLGDDVFWEEP